MASSIELTTISSNLFLVDTKIRTRYPRPPAPSPATQRVRGFSYDDREEILLRPYRPSSLRFSSNSALSISLLAKRSSRISIAARPWQWPPHEGHPPCPWWEPWP